MEGLRDIEPVSFDEVMNYLLVNHDMAEGTNSWALRALHSAASQFHYWVQASLPENTSLRVQLPYHKHGERILIPSSGLSVAKVISKLRGISDIYNSANPVCAATISHFRDGPIDRIILSQAPVSGIDVYDLMDHNPGSLVHVDGLHRLVARFSHNGQGGNAPLKAYIGLNQSLY